MTRIRWSQSTNRFGQVFACADVGTLGLEIIPKLIASSGADVVAIVRLRGRRWATECGDMAEAKRVLVRMARALGAEK